MSTGLKSPHFPKGAILIMYVMGPYDTQTKFQSQIISCIKY